jgi:WD40 repeat protein
LWDAKTGKEVKALPPLDKRLTAMTFTSDAATLLVGGTGPIHRVSLSEGRKTGELPGHKAVVACLGLSPDGKLLASTGADGILRLWSTEDWSEVREVELRACGVFQLAIAPKGEVVTVSADNLIRTISMTDGQVVGRIELPVKGVYGLAFSPDGRYLANAAADGKVRVWQRC